MPQWHAGSAGHCYRPRKHLAGARALLNIHGGLSDQGAYQRCCQRSNPTTYMTGVRIRITEHQAQSGTAGAEGEGLPAVGSGRSQGCQLALERAGVVGVPLAVVAGVPLVGAAAAGPSAGAGPALQRPHSQTLQQRACPVLTPGTACRTPEAPPWRQVASAPSSWSCLRPAQYWQSSSVLIRLDNTGLPWRTD